MSSIEQFRTNRSQGQRRLESADHLGLKRFLRLDTAAYEDGALPARTKELLGLVASMVLRCDDCITYHVERCVTLGVTRPELLEAINVAMVVGGSIVIPHARRALGVLEELEEEATK